MCWEQDIYTLQPSTRPARHTSAEPHHARLTTKLRWCIYALVPHQGRLTWPIVIGARDVGGMVVKRGHSPIGAS